MPSLPSSSPKTLKKTLEKLLGLITEKHSSKKTMVKQSTVKMQQILASKRTMLAPLLKKTPALMSKAVANGVICPDGTSECPDGNTCCKLSSGQYGCCPLPNAVCCSDGEHCCPEGYTCDVSAGTCTKGRKIIALLKKTPASISKHNVKSVICPDGTSECPDGDTCCQLSSGQYGCCPLPHAVCCSDGEHCCPEGYTCDVSAGTCSRGSRNMALLQKIPRRNTGVNDVFCPDGQTECPDGNTCCKLSSGQWGCCPLPNAVCCNDGKHCCPEGYICLPSAGTCIKETKREAVLQTIQVAKNTLDANSVICPDGSSECPDGTTCCKLSSGQWGCCPLPHAVCCSDGVHCCPEGYTCNVANGSCSRESDSVPMLAKIPGIRSKPKENNVICPGGQAQCPDGTTCCKLSSGGWGCCPLPHAVCCSDGVHCCPEGTTCDLANGTCERTTDRVPLVKKLPGLRRNPEENSVVCPDGQSECPDGNTCCKLSSGQFGCCPLPDAVCCSDGEHCCPKGYTCDVSAGTCSKGRFLIALLQKAPAVQRKSDVSNVICPDGSSECPDGTTCCKLSSGQWGCCPLPHAVCCSDGEHCCPEGYTCNVANGSCIRESDSVPMLVKIPGIRSKPKEKSVICPGGESQCPDGTTCCKLSSGGWGCCPLPHAVCCSDGVHCCPEGTTCDLANGTCDRTTDRVPLVKKLPGLRRKPEENSVVCPDGQSECPDGNTCCKLSSGQYGCCPLPDAVCCSDGEHCCPKGYTCDVSAGTCSKRRKLIAMVQKTPAVQRKSDVSNVICPDGSSECPDGTTCCKLSSGQWGCCPLPHAVCCSDGEHCCPEGYTCNVANGTCSKESDSVPMLVKIPGIRSKPKEKSVICPDGESQCPDGTTCCKLSSGGWGCCPLPHAVCCSDGVHCCPEGTTCDLANGTCDRTTDRVPLVKKLPGLRRNPEENSVVCPDGQSECPDGNTCCKLSSGQYGCCPLPDAVCCSDGEHCCPKGYTCDVSAGTCSKGRFLIALLQKAPAVQRKSDVSNVICPDGSSECTDGTTCCKLSSGQWGCCPLPHAVCCSDGQHCCPEGYTCNVANGSCIRESDSVPMLVKLPGIRSKPKEKSVICPGGESQCPDGTTCCKLSSGGWGCCPLPHAVCCSDGVHCCPEGTTCDLSNGTCDRTTDRVPLVKKLPGLRRKPEENSIVCPDGQSECPDGNTCCKLSSGQYGCCPLPDAVCCSDGEHCCPKGYTCDVSAGTCSKGGKLIAMVQKTPAAQRKSDVSNVICPDGTSECPDGTTCCKLSSGQWGCCPLPHAVCCSDGEHCCPEGYTCNVANGTCSKESDSVPMLVKIPGIRSKPEENSVICPGGESQCPDGTTCCKLSSGGWGCCPLPHAVCCSDGVHCCPEGTTCDLANGTCDRTTDRVPLVKKLPGLRRKPEENSVVCPDGQSECPDGNTCCKLSSGQYGCCPLPDAVCCSDGEHCCPKGYTCDVSAGTCSKGRKLIAMVQKTPAVQRKSDVSNVICPDGSFECPDGTTCCKLSSGQWGCCPLPHAVCCSDGEHCCPEGYTCNVANGTCSKESDSVPMLVKIPGIRSKPKEKSVICPGGESQCPDGTTCCKLSSGGWGCCPLPHAVCCSDGVHCCPEGTTCDLANGTCDRTTDRVPLVKKLPGLRRKPEENSIVCPDGQSECPDGNTCCKLSSGQYGCCPLPDAVCCSDGEHCCPKGYTCDVSAGTCSKWGKLIAMVQKTPAVQRKSDVSNVICPDGTSECPDGTTCCKLSSGQWGCCPLPHAVCCSDGEHCCPEGYTCNVANSTCSKESDSVPMLVKIPGIRSKPKEKSVICPGGESQCPDGTTCCKLSSGGWGCCPLPHAVCCSDGVHCCPEGTTCDLANGTCDRTTDRVPLVKKLPGLRRKPEENSVVCPDGQSECPDGSTCCKLSSGQYGCCPLPDAVCCSDGEHCCPKGYTCDVSAGTCSKGRKLIAMVQKTPAVQRKSDVSNVICPDGSSECPDGTTCCKLSSGQWGCCPLPHAVCCSDGEHCCPEGYTCNVANGTCIRENESVTMLVKVQGIRSKPKEKSVICPGGESQCPDGTTCCKLSSGGWGCCPLPHAVCCSDGVHCCPEGTTCDLANGTCDRTTDRVPLVKKLPGLRRKPEENSIVCPDGQSECPDGNTCCKLSSGQYGCCPLPDAVCCSDGEHCCPEGYTCDVSAGTCSKGRKLIAMVQKTPAVQRKSDVSNVICPDGSSECPDGTTCCKLSSGQWGCCPLPHAVCCSDGEHCCPEGYTCDVTAGTCTKGSSSIKLLQTITALKRITHTSALGGVVCPDKKYRCPDGSTCCKLPSGTYGCCPIENAVCCSDHKHCCPEGYTCDVKEGM